MYVVLFVLALGVSCDDHSWILLRDFGIGLALRLIYWITFERMVR